MKYSKERAIAQIAAASLKSAILPNGTELSLVSIVEQELDNGQPNDILLCESKDGNIRVPVRELMKMKTEDGSSVYGSEEGATEVELPGKFKIVSAEPRTDRDGDAVYPIFAYNKAQEQLDAGGIDWAELKAGGLKANNGGFDQVQNYTIATM